MNISFVTRSVLLLSIFSFLVSCGSQRPMISDFNVESVTDQGEVLVSMDAVLSIGNVSLSDITLPIIIPRSQKEVGSISMYTNLEGQNKFEIEINLSQIANISVVSATLPNGNSLPLIRDNDVIVIPVADKAKVYLAFSNGVAALGATVSIKGLDSVGQSTGTASLFPNFNINQVIGSAGIYTSRTRGQNGFGIFADISNIIDTRDLLGADAKFAQLESSENDLKLNYSSISPSRSTKRRLDRKLYRLHRKKSIL